MSFNDVAKQRANRPAGQATQRTSVTSNDPFVALSDSMITLQKSCVQVKEKISEMRRRKVGPAEKNELDIKLQELRTSESRIKIQLDHESKALDNAPRTEVAQKRLAFSKLQKDYDRIKMLIQALSSEAAMIRVTLEGESKPRKPVMDEDTPVSSEPSRAVAGQGPVLVAIHGDDIDAMILEERERDIRKINQDIALVHEMFKDMAEIVGKQGEMIESIHDTTETSHAQAKAGLEQVNLAAKHQPGCIIS